MTDAPSTTRDGLVTSAGPRAGRWRPLALLALLAVSFALYGRTLSYPFVLDDDQVIVRNAFVHHPGNPLEFFISDYSRGTGFGPGYYRPLMMASFWVQGAALGWNPLWFHAVSVLLHGLVAWAVALLAAALGCSPTAAFLGGLLFAVYPPGDAAVASVVARCDLLAVLFLIFAWRTQLRHEHDLIRTRRAAASIFVLSFLAMAGKENGAVICGLVPLTALFYALRSRGRHHPRARPDRLILCGTVLAALLVYGALRQVALQSAPPATPPGADAGLASSPAGQARRTSAALYVTGRQLLALLAPVARLSIPLDLSPRRAWPLDGPVDPRLLLPALLLLLGFAGAVVLLCRGSIACLPLTLVLLGLLPTSGLLVRLLSSPAEHHLYLPSAGVALLAALGAETWRRARPGVSMRGAAAGAAVLLGLFAWLGSSRAVSWSSEEALMRDWATRFPYNPVVWNRLGLAALRRGEPQRARQWLEHSLDLDPDNPQVLRYLGQILAQQGLRDEAVAGLRRAVDLRPDDASLRVQLGRLYLSLGRREEALREADTAYALSPAGYGARLLLASARYETGDFEEAVRLFGSLVQEDPRDATAQQGLILSLDRSGRGGEAEAAAREAARQLPDQPLFELWLARFAARAGRNDAAVEHLLAGATHGGPLEEWLREVNDLATLRRDPRLRPPARAPAAEDRTTRP